MKGKELPDYFSKIYCDVALSKIAGEFFIMKPNEILQILKKGIQIIQIKDSHQIVGLCR